jgi:hypothetical protein
MIETKTTERDPQTPLGQDLLRLRGFLEESDIEGARAFVKELEQRWPDSEMVRHFVRVLAPPEVRVLPGVRIRRLDRENAWLREHAREYPGCWLAIRGDRLVAADPDLGGGLATVRQAPETEEPIHFYQTDFQEGQRGI